VRFYLEKQILKLTELEQENQQLKIIVRQQLAAAKINASDALLPQQEAIALTLLRDELNSQRRQAIAQLQQFVGDNAQLGLAGEPPLWSPQLDSLQSHLDRHPDLQVIGAQRSQQQAKIADASAARQADWSYELSYQKRGREFGDMVSLQWSIELPFFNRGRRDADLTQQYADAATLQAEQESLRREHKTMLSNQIADYQRLQQKQARLQNEIVPLLAQKVALIKAQWRNDKSTLSELIAAQQERLSNELNVIATQQEMHSLAATFMYSYPSNENELEGQTP
jgi:hypothetical protein